MPVRRDPPANTPPKPAPRLQRPELDAALAQGWISVRYQPVVRIADRRPVALEVLARLEHPARGTLSPDLFIPPMEQSGLAWPLTQAVVRRAFAEFDGARLRSLDLSLAVNFTRDVLLLPSSAEWLAQTCADAGIDPEHITVELTESQPVGDPADVSQGVARLRAAGFGLAIDDVGPAIRDHSALLDMGFTVMKLDKDLVAGSAVDAQTEAFLARALAAARAADLLVIAEGIETEAAWQRMAALGVQQAQGYLIARPMPAAQVAGWHAAWLGSDPAAD